MSNIVLFARTAFAVVCTIVTIPATILATEVYTITDVNAIRQQLAQRIEDGHLAVSSGPTCGVYATCRALSLMQISVDPGKYFSPRYIGNSAGSTASELLEILNNFPVTGVPLNNLSKIDIMALGYPVIANVKQHAAADSYDHWITVVYTDRGLFAYDGSGEAVEIAWDEFLRTWSGYGIVVTRDSQAMVLVMVWLSRAALMALCLAIVFGVWRIFHAKVTKEPTTSVVALAVAVLSLSLVINIAFLGPRFVPEWTNRHFGELPQTREASKNEFLETVQTGQRLIIDARHASSFRMGSVANAMNIPVSVSRLNLFNLMAPVPFDCPILVFCQSESCGFDEVLGAKFVDLGYKDVAVSRMGYREYVAERFDKNKKLQ